MPGRSRRTGRRERGRRVRSSCRSHGSWAWTASRGRRTGAAYRMRSRISGRETVSPVSIQTASAWPTTTGTAHAVALHGQIGSSRILRVSSRSLTSSSYSEAVELPVHAQLMVVGVLRPELGDGVGACAGHRLGTSRPARSRARRRRAAVRAPSSAESCSSSGFATIPVCSSARSPFTSGTTSGIPRSSRNAADLSTQSAPAPAARGTSSRLDLRADREEADVEVAGAQRRGRRLLYLEVPEPPAGGTPRGERADVGVSAIDQVPERDLTDQAGRTDDADTEVGVDHRRSVRKRRERAQKNTEPADLKARRFSGCNLGGPFTACNPLRGEKDAICERNVWSVTSRVGRPVPGRASLRRRTPGRRPPGDRSRAV
mgnify:CR=1 FL=1